MTSIIKVPIGRGFAFVQLNLLIIAVACRRAKLHPLRSATLPRCLIYFANHAQAIWAGDLFVIQTLTFQTLTFQTLYVLFFLGHGRRQLVHFEVTAHPTAAWVWQQLIEATPWNRKPQYLIHDRDRVWGADFSQRTTGLGIKSLRTPIQVPRANSIAERWVRTVRRECLDHLIPLSERHLRAILTEIVRYHNCNRPHRSLGCSLRLRGRRARTAESLSDLSSEDSTTSISEQLEPDRLLPPYRLSFGRPADPPLLSNRRGKVAKEASSGLVNRVQQVASINPSAVHHSGGLEPPGRSPSRRT